MARENLAEIPAFADSLAHTRELQLHPPRQAETQAPGALYLAQVGRLIALNPPGPPPMPATPR